MENVNFLSAILILTTWFGVSKGKLLINIARQMYNFTSLYMYVCMIVYNRVSRLS